MSVHGRRAARQGGRRIARAGARRPRRARARAAAASRITVNLAPADLLKEGSHFDLPIALGLLAAMEVLPAEELAGYTRARRAGARRPLTPVAGVLPAAIGASARAGGISARRVRRRGGVGRRARRAGAGLLIALVNHFKGTQVLSPPEPGAGRRRGRCPTSTTSRARRAPSARWRSPPPAATIC